MTSSVPLPPLFSCVSTTDINLTNSTFSQTTTTPPSLTSGTGGISPKPFIDVSDLHWTIYEAISSIQDPEFNQTLEELEVLSEASLVIVDPTQKPPQHRLLADSPHSINGLPLWGPLGTHSLLIQITFRPTVPHCSYASQIGLSIIYTICQVLNDFNFSPPIPPCMIGDSTEIGNDSFEDGRKQQNEASFETSLWLKKSKFVKIQVLLEPKSHQSEHDLNRQLNDKERVLAAFENPTLISQIKKLCNVPNRF